MTRPDLNITDELTKTAPSKEVTAANDLFLIDSVTRFNVVMNQLTEHSYRDHQLMTFPSGRIEMIQIPDLSLGTYQYTQPFTNLKMEHGGGMLESKSGTSVSIQFRDDKQLRLHRMIHAWVHYIDAVKRGALSPKQRYIIENRFDYMCSIYYFLCGPTGTDIRWWCKFTGCFPSEVPTSDMSFNLGGGGPESTFSVNFNCFWYEPCDLSSLIEFNQVTKVGNLFGNASKTNLTVLNSIVAPWFSDTFNGTGMTLAGAPFVIAQMDGKTLSNPTLCWRRLEYDGNFEEIKKDTPLPYPAPNGGINMPIEF
jgi:hypothetical protein